jgi:probable phosphoglycerate mutase
LWLVRHGETTGNSAERYFGRTDVPLADAGRRQVRRLVPFLAAGHFDVVVHSPLSRATESARILLDGLRHEPARVESESAFREVDFGDLEGKSAVEIEAEQPEWYRRWQVGDVEGYPGGETLVGFASRIGAGIDDVLRRFDAHDLLVVVHRGVIKAALVHLLKLPKPVIRSWSLDLGSLSVVVQDEDGRWLLDRYNVVGHDCRAETDSAPGKR